MKKLQRGFCAILLAALVLAGCSRSKDATKPDNVPDLPPKDIIKKKDPTMPKAPVPNK